MNSEARSCMAVSARLLGKTPYRVHRMRGMTLIELMTVVVVIAILGSLAVNSYRNYLLRANRTEARMALLTIQAAQEKFFLQNNQYATAAQMSTAPPGGLGVGATTPSGFYTISITRPSATTYTATATAAAGQLKDTAACLTMTINELGARTPAESSGCWK
jgi:type IV pilus assembly protein PilE